MRMVNKKIRIEFVKSGVNAIDHIADIRKGVESASLNLYSRYGIQLQTAMPEGNRVVLELRIPDDLIDGFSYGNRLRGISTYLLTKCGDRYTDYQVGRRLLMYVEVGFDQMQNVDETRRDRMKAIEQFAKLLQRNDDVALNRIERINDILEEQD